MATADETSAPASVYQAFTIPASGGGAPAAGDDSDEWEYEYSQTETETYYVTLDLTTSSTSTSTLTINQPNGQKPGQGSGKYKWINSGLNRHKRQINRRQTTAPVTQPSAGHRMNAGKRQASTSVSTPVTPGNDIGSIDMESGDRPEYIGQDELDFDDTAQQVSDQMPRDEVLQILNLHSNNPLVEYKGQTFSCHWATNIGTDLLFTAHNPHDPLPALRSLKDDVDLLAASSARLVSKPVVVEPILRSGKDALEAQRGPDKHARRAMSSALDEERRDQAFFLEQLADIKKSMGERDPVPISTTKRLTRPQWVAEIRETRKAEREKLTAQFGEGGQKEADAKRRLAEMEGEDTELMERARYGAAFPFSEEHGNEGRPGTRVADGAHGSQGPRGRGTRGRRRGRPRGQGGRSGGQIQADMRTGGTGSGLPTSRELSVPTPESWDLTNSET